MSSVAVADARIRGQLLLMQSVVASLPDASILSFVTQGLADLPGVVRADLQAGERDEDSPSMRFQLDAGTQNFGEIVLTLKDFGAFSAYVDHVRNFAFMVALILEERRQRRIAERHQAELEQAVKLRTAELAESAIRRDVTSTSPASCCWP